MRGPQSRLSVHTSNNLSYKVLKWIDTIIMPIWLVCRPSCHVVFISRSLQNETRGSVALRVSPSFRTASARVIMCNVFTFWQIVKWPVEVEGLTQDERKTVGVRTC